MNESSRLPEPRRKEMQDKGMRRYIENAPVEVQDFIYEGNIIEAAKFLMNNLGMSPGEAYMKVKKWRAEMSARFPEELPPPPPYYLGRIIIWATLITMLLAGVVAFIIISTSK